MKILITGSAGFIGYHLSKYLLSLGFDVVGLDNLNAYYDVNLKRARLMQLNLCKKFEFHLLDLSDSLAIFQLFEKEEFSHVINLAAQAGVRYSLENPQAYIDSNITGFLNLLEACKLQKDSLEHLIFASSSSVYGTNTKIPFATTDLVDSPVSLYAASKKANELMAHSYSHLYGFPVTGLRFFTVYGPWGRPDMAYFKFVKAIKEGRPIDIYNHGKMQRDFTYIDDIVEGIYRLIQSPVKSRKLADQSSYNQANYKIYNIGNNQPILLSRFIEAIEMAVGQEAKKNYLPMQPGDVPVTYADVSELMQDIGFKPETSIEDGMKRFVDWYNFYAEQSAYRIENATEAGLLCSIS